MVERLRSVVMKRRLPRLGRARTPLIIAASALAGAVLVSTTGASAAVASVLLGRSNFAASQTNISNSAGTPLGLNAKSGHAPLAVNSSKQVNKLNAEYLQGYHASSFAKVSGKNGIIVSTTIAKCPKGSFLTGGGGFGAASLDYSGPEPVFSADGKSIIGFVPNTWWALSLDSGTVYSYAVCYSPTGAAIPGAGVVPPVAASALKAATSTNRDLQKSLPGPTPSATRPTPSPVPSPSAG